MVFPLDLSQHGMEVHLDLLGDVVEEFTLPGAPLVLLFDENHGYADGIRQSLRNACKLIDAGAVDFVGVEGYPQGVRERVDSAARAVGLSGLGEYVARLKATGASDEALMETQVHPGGKLFFAEALLVLRPGVRIVSVEDPALYANAGAALRAVRESVGARLLPAMAAAMVECIKDAAGDVAVARARMAELRTDIHNRLAAEAAAELKRDVSAPRDEAMVENLLSRRREAGATKAAILNAGRCHQEEVARMLRERELAAFVRVRPTGYPQSDALADIAE